MTDYREYVFNTLVVIDPLRLPMLDVLAIHSVDRECQHGLLPGDALDCECWAA